MSNGAQYQKSRPDKKQTERNDMFGSLLCVLSNVDSLLYQLMADDRIDFMLVAIKHKAVRTIGWVGAVT